ncbi:MAG: DNA-directed RNA polymerase subunit omega [Actinobacteria bacterium]|jgi:DNA-directed RNA polymerase subunit omega|nr:DNA-directed RNA polymerase subunit omega [Actinomycetota bacterium]
MAQVNGIIDPPIDDLLEKVDSKYALVVFASQRARQINDYYTDLHDGNLFDNVGPLVDASVDDKPLSTALHEIAEGKLEMKPRVHVAPEAALEAALDAIELDDAIEGTEGE